MDWLSALAELREQGRAGVLVTVTRVRGHVPRDAGAKMLVTARDSVDTIGGGNLEATVVERAREMLRDGQERPEILEMKLNPHAPVRHGRQCCGGEAEVLLEPIPAPPVVAIFGMGHVGLELAHVLSRHPLVLHLVDSRADQVDADRLGPLAAGAARVQGHHAPAPETVLRDLPAGAHVLIMTHDHAETWCCARPRCAATASWAPSASSAPTPSGPASAPSSARRATGTRRSTASAAPSGCRG